MVNRRGESRPVSGGSGEQLGLTLAADCFGRFGFARRRSRCTKAQRDVSLPHSRYSAQRPLSVVLNIIYLKQSIQFCLYLVYVKSGWIFILMLKICSPVCFSRKVRLNVFSRVVYHMHKQSLFLIIWLLRHLQTSKPSLTHIDPNRRFTIIKIYMRLFIWDKYCEQIIVYFILRLNYIKLLRRIGAKMFTKRIIIFL